MANGAWDKLTDKNGVAFSPRDIDWGGEERTNNQGLSGRLIQDWLKESLSSKWGWVISDGKYYRAFADEDAANKWLSNPAANTDLVLGTFEAPANYIASIELLSEQNVSVMKGVKGHFIEFVCKTKSRDGAAQIENVIVVIQFSNNGNKLKTTKIFKTGDTCRVNIDEFLLDGVNTISITTQGQDTQATARASIIYNVVDLSLVLDSDLTKLYHQTDNLLFNYRVTGAGTKFVEWYVDGVKQGEDDVINVNLTQQKVISANDLAKGVHHVQARAYIVSSGQKFYSKTSFRSFFVGDDSVMIGFAFDLGVGALINEELSTSNLTQYSPWNLSYTVYDPSGNKNQVEFSVDNTVVSLQEVKNATIYQFSITPSGYGSHTLSVKLKNKTINIQLEIAKSEAAIEEATNGLLLKLDASGRSNSEVNRDTWVYKEITSTFSNFRWTNNDGWQNGRLVIRNGAVLKVNFKPFQQDWKLTGGTIELTFSTSDVVDEDAIICDMTDNNGKGLKITASSAQMSSSGSNPIVTRFKSNEEHKIAIIVQKADVNLVDKSIITIMVDGILDRAINYANSNTIQSLKEIIIGDPHGKCSVALKSIRVYNRQLAEEEEFRNFAVDSGDVLSIFNKNDIYQTGTETFSLEKLKSRIPVMVITGDIDELMAREDKKYRITVPKVEYTNLKNPELSFSAENVTMTLQGTSSLTYPRKNFKIKFKGSKLYNSEGVLQKNSKYAFRSNSQAVGTYCLKADFAESSGVHNTGMARIVNDAMFNAVQGGKHLWRTKAQEKALANNYPYDVRTAIDGFPIVLFYKKTENSSLVYLGQYNFNNDKSTESVFGFRDIPGFNKGCVNYGDGNLVVLEREGDETLSQMEERFKAMPSWTKPSSSSIDTLPQGSKDTSLLYLLKVEREYKFYEYVDEVWKDTTGNASQIGHTNSIQGRVLNPVECWETLQNANDLALFLDSSTFFDDVQGKPKWTTAFECRFPDGGKDTTNLKILCDWLVSCRNNQAKWNKEKSEHFDLPKLAAYYSYWFRHGAVDQLVKNTMFCTEDGQHWFFINYDNDTILGVRNDGQLKYGPYIDRQSLDEEQSTQTNKVYAYAGHESTLWNCFEGDPECMKLAKEADSALAAVAYSYDKVLKIFDNDQADQWCERIYNTNGRFKYIKPFLNQDKNYLSSAQGSRRSHRHWWLKNRYDFVDSLFVTGEYVDKSITFKIDASAGSKFEITAGKALQYGAGSNNVPIQTNVALKPGDKHQFVLPQHLIIGDPVRVYAANNLAGLDLSISEEFISSLVSLDLTKVKESDGSSKLKYLFLNRETGSISNSALSDLSSVSNCSALEELNIRNFLRITSLPLGALKNLKKFLAGGSGLTVFEPSAGCRFDTVQLPVTLQAVSLNSATIDTFDYEPNVYLKNVSLVATELPGGAYNFVKTWIDAQITHGDLTQCSLKLEGINWTKVSAEFLISLAKIPNIANSISGYVKLEKINNNQYNQIVQIFGDKCFTYDSSFRIDAHKNILLSGPAEITVYQSVQYNAHSFPIVQDPPTLEYVLVVGSQVQPIRTNGLTRFSIYRNVSLNVDSGLLTTNEDVSGDTSVKVRARLKDDPDTKSVDLSLRVKALSYPTAVFLNGPTSIVTPGIYSYSLTFNPEDFTGKIKTIEYEAQGDNQYGYIQETSNNTRQCKFFVSNVPETDSEFILVATVTFADTSKKKVQIRVIVGQDYAVKESRNPAVFERLYAAHLCANSNYMTYQEAAAVTPEQLGTIFKSSGIVSFNEFKHFTGINRLPDSVFEACSALKSIELPPTLISMGTKCFYSCSSLKTIVLPESLTTVTDSQTDTGVFMNCLLLEEITLGSKLTELPQNFLRGCSALKTVDLKQVTTLASACFAYCSNLESVKLSSRPLSLMDGVFCGCTSLKELTLPEGTQFSYRGYSPLPPFGYCSSLTKIVLPKTLTTLALPSYIQGAFYGCTSLKDIYCYAENAPDLGQSLTPFGDGESSWVGRKQYSTGDNILHVLQTAVGFSDGNSPWKEPLQNSSKCGFTLAKELVNE